MNAYLTKDGRPFTIRPPIVDQAQELINYSKCLFVATDQVLTTLQEYTITAEKEEKWIQTLNENENALLLIAEMANHIVGLLFFIPNSKRKMSHTGELGISVALSYQGLGIGQRLMETLLDWSRQNNQIEKVFLQVFATNQKAINLYRKLGFVEEGRHIKAVKQADGSYVDLIQMYVDTH